MRPAAAAAANQRRHRRLTLFPSPLLLQAFTKNFDEKLKQDEIDLYGEYISPDATALDPAEADESEGGDEGGDAGGDDAPPAPPVDDTPDIL